jgi:hypothetical protein
MVESYHLTKDSIEPSRAAIMATEDSDGIVSIDDDSIRVTFREAPLELDYLIRHHGFKTQPRTASKENIILYKRRY